MKTKEITASYSRTLNTGDHQFQKLGFSMTAELEEGENATEAARALWDATVNQVNARAAGIREEVTVETRPASVLPAAVVPPVGDAPPAASPPVANAAGYDGEFPATTLVCTMHEGKTFWKLTDVPGTQYPVNIWPEVLEAAGFDPDALDPRQSYSLTGYTARFIKNEKGYPNKIVELIQAGGVTVTTQVPPPKA